MIALCQPRLSFTRAVPWLLGSAVLLLAGCNQQGGASRERVFAADVTGAAKKCEAPSPSVTDGKTSEAALKVANDGGWCGISLSRSGRPYDAALLTARPMHGRVVVNRVGDTTRITYTPAQRFVGSDTFAVKLIPGDAVVRVTATVTAN